MSENYTRYCGRFIETDDEKTQIYYDANSDKICIKQCNEFREREGENIDDYEEEKGLSIIAFSPHHINLMVEAIQEADKDRIKFEEEEIKTFEEIEKFENG